MAKILPQPKKTEGQKHADAADREVAQEYKEPVSPPVSQDVLDKAKNILAGLTEDQKSKVIASMTIELQEQRKMRLGASKKWYDVYLKGRMSAVDVNKDVKDGKLTPVAAIETYKANVMKICDDMLTELKSIR
jgi:hypothetical protein